jgi:Tol biopolymer transport system component
MATGRRAFEGARFNAVWLPDASGVVFSARRGGPPHLFRRDFATGVEAELLPAGPVQAAEDISPDGRLLVFSQRGERGDADAWVLPLSAEGTRLGPAQLARGRAGC